MPSSAPINWFTNPGTYVMITYVMFCVFTLGFDVWAGMVFVGLGMVGSLAAGYLVYQNRKLCESDSHT
jgi:hypothetical protein